VAILVLVSTQRPWRLQPQGYSKGQQA